MRASSTFIILLFCGISQLAFAQYREADEGFAFRAVAPNHQYLIDNELIRSDFGIGLEFEYLRHLSQALNFSLPLRLTQVKLPMNDTGPLKGAGNIGLDLLLHLKYFREPNVLYPHLYAGIGGSLQDMRTWGYEVPVGVGLNFRLNRHFYLTTKAEYRLGIGNRRDNVMLGAGLLFLLGPGTPQAPTIVDRDKDGVQDSEDLCPDVPGLAGLNGCPDADRDGVADGEDKCPDIAGVASLGGCPDTDADGIADGDDECPNEAGLPENKGCPLRDADGDGVADANDECPDQPGPVATRGCPDGDGDGVADKEDRCPAAAGPATTGGCPDTDGDGIIDPDDRCPNTPGIAANSGCPEIKQEDKETLNFAMSAVQFETASANLIATSSGILDQIVDIMKRYPDYKLRVNGHTDSIGSSAPNLSLSEKRAKACYDYLVGKGISAARMSYKGFGESQPIADNRYKAGREKNRRVEFDLYLE